MRLEARVQIHREKLNLLRVTRASQYFLKLTGVELFSKESNLPSTHSAMLKDVNKKTAENVSWILKFVTNSVLKPLQVFKDQIFSFPLNVPSMFKSVQGYSGTIDEIFIFPHEIIWPVEESSTMISKSNVIFDEGSSGWVLQCLLKDDTGAHFIDFDSFDSMIESILSLFVKDGHLAQQRVLIDLGAQFKGISNEMVARKLAKMFNSIPNNTIEAVLFFDNISDRPVFLRIDEAVNGKPIEIGGTGAKLIKRVTKLPSSKIFTYLDNNHFTGVDVLQMHDARAVVTTSTETTIRDLVQAVMRLRGLTKHQRVDFVFDTEVSKYMEVRSIEKSIYGYIKLCLIKSVEHEKMFYQKVGYQKATQLYKAAAVEEVLEASNSSERLALRPVQRSRSPKKGDDRG